jgi:hypothetical protein
MNRRTFFRNLVVGAAALPAVVKVCGEERSPAFIPPLVGGAINQAWVNAEYQVDFIMPAGSYYRGMNFATDMYPLRFNR